MLHDPPNSLQQLQIMKYKSPLLNWGGGGAAEKYHHVFLTYALGGGDWSASSPGSFTHKKKIPAPFG
jgi:hypothetical protein